MNTLFHSKKKSWQKGKSDFTFIDLFSGIGGFRIALENIHGKCVGFSEIEKKAIGVYNANFDLSEEVIIGDITKANNIPYADILVGGVPCQSWSIAGKMRGFEDPRGKLWLDTIRVTKEVRPKAFIFENVKGLADPRNKYNLDLIITEFNNLGYSTYYKVLNAFDFGIPQSRERLFIVGIKKKIEKNSFVFPEKYTDLPFLSDVIENGNKSNKKVNNLPNNKNGFNMASITNKGNFYIFCDIRNGDNTIHSWDLINTSKKEKDICLLILKNRRKSLYGKQDGNPMSYKDIASLFLNGKDTISLADIENLVNKKILRRVNGKYEFVHSKISSGINGVYRIFLPESHVFSTLTKSGSRDYVSDISIPISIKNKKEYFIKEIYLKNKYRQISTKEASRIQGFPEDFIFEENHSTNMGLLGNAVAVNVVKEVAKKLLTHIK